MEADRSFIDPVLWSGLLAGALLLDLWFAFWQAILGRFSLRELLVLHKDHPEESERLIAFWRQRGVLIWWSQAGLLLAHFALATLIGLGLWSYRVRWQIWPWVLALTALVVVLLEGTVGAWAERRRARWGLRVVRWAERGLRWMRPFSTVFARLFPMRPREGFTEEMLDAMAQVTGTGDAALDEEERHMISSVVRFETLLVREIMVPRIDMVTLSVTTTVEQALETFLRTGFSRIPVYRDTVDDIVGLLYAKDLLRVWHEGRQVASLEPLLRPAHFVPEAKRVGELLTEMQAQRIHMVIVVDEYGGVAGLVTLEDIVEEIVGEIQDEYDQAEVQLYRPVGEGEYLLQGRLDLDDFADLMGVNLDKVDAAEEADTVGGLIYALIGKVPEGGESVRLGDVELIVEQVQGRRIALVRARRLSPPSEEEHDA